MKNTKVLILKNGTVLISEIQEVPSELGEPDCKLVNPKEINSDMKFNSWPKYTDQTEIMIHSDSILTIVEPNKEILETYNK